MGKRRKTGVMDQFWKKQNKRQMTQNKNERNKQRLQKLAQMDPVEIRVEIRKLERQMETAPDGLKRRQHQDKINQLEKGFKEAVVRAKLEEEREATKQQVRQPEYTIKGLDRLVRKRGATDDPEVEDDEQDVDEDEDDYDEEELEATLNIAVEDEDDQDVAMQGDVEDLLEEFEIPSDLEQGDYEEPPEEPGFQLSAAEEGFHSDEETTLLLMPPGLSPLLEFPPAPFQRIDKFAYLELGRLRPPPAPTPSHLPSRPMMPGIPPMIFGHPPPMPPAQDGMMPPLFLGLPGAPPISVPAGFYPGPPAFLPSPQQPQSRGGSDRLSMGHRPHRPHHKHQQDDSFDPLAMNHPLYAEDRRTVRQQLQKEALGRTGGAGPMAAPSQEPEGPQPPKPATADSDASHHQQQQQQQQQQSPQSEKSAHSTPEKPSAAPLRPAFVPAALLRPRVASVAAAPLAARRNIDRIAASLNASGPAPSLAPPSLQASGGKPAEAIPPVVEQDEELQMFMSSLGGLI